ncbi:hypothetical protein OPT61_g3973 [Boeremia exigua]|uniref:Uncharacterized protein n=1 Tax=Boeremia exigua TaxID=749465 RepID=A0ACC2IFY0_9PLEO|nr:hypothetical protein OPT61_g3973 [Boeremia exigua]
MKSQPRRTTRSSTQAQTAKSQKNNQTSTKSVTAESTARVKKPRAKARNESQKAFVSKAKATAKAKPEQPNEAKKKEAESDAHSSLPSNITTLAIEDDRVKTPITCHEYAPSTATTPPGGNQPPLVFTHGAGGTLSAPAVVHFCTGFSSTSATPLLAFQGSMNLGARVKGFHACHAHVTRTTEAHSKQVLVFGGRSMGARAAVVAATQIASEKTDVEARLILVSYPLQGPKDVRDQILLDLPERSEVLFVVGDRDTMCPIELLEQVRRKMKAASRLVIVRGADHGMNVKPASKTREVGEETGRVAARWLCGEIENGSEALYVGDEG